MPDGSTRSTSPSRATTRTEAPGASARSLRACHRSPCTITCPACPAQSSTAARVPISASPPVRTGSRRARTAALAASSVTPRPAAARPPTSGHDTVNSGSSESTSIVAPSANATTPPMPSTPSDGVNASATISATPSSSSAAPA
jgi:hypothetical protein